MLHSSIGKVILDGLFALSDGDVVKFDGNVYLGLLTRLPNDNYTAYEDGTYFSEPNDEGYFRVQIDTTSRITKENFISPAEVDSAVEVGEDMALPAYVTNQAMIMFPESNVDWDTVVGFGLWRTSTSTNLPFLWGSVSSTDGEEGVTVKQYEVPIIRAGGFKISLV